MFDILLEKIKQMLSSRFVPVGIVFIFLFSILVNRLFSLQIVNGDLYTENLSVKDVRTREIKSTRGNILDRNGVLLATNELSYSVVCSESSELTTNKDKNAMLYNLIQILEKHGNELEIEFAISIDEKGKLYFNDSKNAVTRFKKNVYRPEGELDEEQIKASAEDVFNYMRHGTGNLKMFDISDDYNLEVALKIMKLRYAIYSNWPAYNQVIICSGVNDETVAAILENKNTLPGVEIEQQTYRKYEDSIYFSHILGYTGLINAQELEEKQKESDYYNSSDVIGKSGIEQRFESYLAGKKGIEKISVNTTGKYVDTIERTDPVAGNDIYLTIDSKLQKAIYKMIEKNLAGIILSKINNSMDAGTRGKSSKDIRIPIYDVYFNLLNNNVIDIDQFDDPDASSLEKQVYSKFLIKQKEISSDLKTLLSVNNSQLPSSLSDEMNDYLTYIYKKILVKNDIVVASKVDYEDQKYLDFHNGKMSLSQFLQYAIAKNWVDLDKLDVGNKYYSTEELYKKLLDYIINYIKGDDNFNKKLYYYLVYSYRLSGNEICLLLFDQNVIKYNKDEKSGLENGTLSAYSFITNKIAKLEITPAQLALPPSSASVVVTDVKTGDVLALVSYPSYDNNKLANKIDTEYFTKLTNDITGPLNLRATKQKTAPGSTFKMISAVAALEEGVVGPNETIYDQHTFTKITPSPKDWADYSHGSVDVPNALEVSCNYFFYEVGWRLGLGSANRDQTALDKIKKYASLFGLNEKSGIELEETEPQISNKDSIRSAIGQGNHAYAPVQLSRYVTSVANSGTLFDLTIMDKIVDKDNKVILQKDPKFRTLDSVKDSTWNLVHEGMYKVANGPDSSSSNVLKNLGVTIAGKTGTAQESTLLPNHALFVSYAPYEAPEISVTVVIPNGFASSTAVDLGKDIYSYYFNLEDAETLTEGSADLPKSISRGVVD